MTKESQQSITELISCYITISILLLRLGRSEEARKVSNKSTLLFDNMASGSKDINIRILKIKSKFVLALFYASAGFSKKSLFEMSDALVFLEGISPIPGDSLSFECLSYMALVSLLFLDLQDLNRSFSYANILSSHVLIHMKCDERLSSRSVVEHFQKALKTHNEIQNQNLFQAKYWLALADLIRARGFILTSEIQEASFSHQRALMIIVHLLSPSLHLKVIAEETKKLLENQPLQDIQSKLETVARQRPNSSSLFLFKSSDGDGQSEEEINPYLSHQDSVAFKKIPKSPKVVRISHKKSSSISINSIKSKETLNEMLSQKKGMARDIASSTNFKSFPNSLLGSPKIMRHSSTANQHLLLKEVSSVRFVGPEPASGFGTPKPYNLFRSGVGRSVGSFGLISPQGTGAPMTKQKVFQTHHRTVSGGSVSIKKRSSAGHSRTATTLVIFENKNKEEGENIGAEELAMELNLIEKREEKEMEKGMRDFQKHLKENIMVPYRKVSNEASFLTRENMKSIMVSRATSPDAQISSRKPNLTLNVNLKNYNSYKSSKNSSLYSPNISPNRKPSEPQNEEQQRNSKGSLNNLSGSVKNLAQNNSKQLEESNIIENNSSFFLNTSVADLRAAYNVPEGKKKLQYKNRQQIQAELDRKVAAAARQSKNKLNSFKGLGIAELLPLPKELDGPGNQVEGELATVSKNNSSPSEIELNLPNEEKKNRTLSLGNSEKNKQMVKRKSLQLSEVPEISETLLKPPGSLRSVKMSPGAKSGEQHFVFLNKAPICADLGNPIEEEEENEEEKKRHQSAEKIQKFFRWLAFGRKKDEVCPFLPRDYKGTGMVEMLKKEFESAVYAKHLVKMTSFPFSVFLGFKGVSFLEVAIPPFSNAFITKKLRLQVTHGKNQMILEVGLREADMDSIIKEHQNVETIWPFMADLLRGLQSFKFSQKDTVSSTHGCRNSQIASFSRVDRRSLKETVTLIQTILNKHSILFRKTNGAALKIATFAEQSLAKGIRAFLKKHWRRTWKKLTRGENFTRNLFKERKKAKRLVEPIGPETRKQVLRFWFQRAVKEVKFIKKFEIKNSSVTELNQSELMKKPQGAVASVFWVQMDQADRLCSVEIRPKVKTMALVAQPPEKLFNSFLLEAVVSFYDQKRPSKTPVSQQTASLAELGLNTEKDLVVIASLLIGRTPPSKWQRNLQETIKSKYLVPEIPQVSTRQSIHPSLPFLGYLFPKSTVSMAQIDEEIEGNNDNSVCIIGIKRNWDFEAEQSALSEDNYQKKLFLRQFNYYMSQEMMKKSTITFQFDLLSPLGKKVFGKFSMNLSTTKFVISVYNGVDSNTLYYRSSSRAEWEQACQWMSPDSLHNIPNVLSTQLVFANELIGRKIELKALSGKSMESEYRSSSQRSLYFSVQTGKQNMYIKEKFKRTEYNLFTSIVNLGLCYVRVWMFDSTHSPRAPKIQLFLFQVFPSNSKTKMFRFCFNSFDALQIFGEHDLDEIIRSKSRMVNYLTELVSMFRCHRCLLGGRLMIPSAVLAEERLEKISFNYDLENELMNQLASFTSKSQDGEINTIFKEDPKEEKVKYLQPKVHCSFIILSTMRKFNGQFCLVIIEKNVNLKAWVFRLYFPKTCRRFVCYLYPNDLMRMDMKLLKRIRLLPKVSRIYWKAGKIQKSYNEFREFAHQKMKEMDSAPIFGDSLTIDVQGESGDQMISTFENKVLGMESKRKEQKKKTQDHERTNILKEFRSILGFNSEKMRAKSYKKQGKSKLKFTSEQRDFQEMFLWESFVLDLHLVPASFEGKWLLVLNKFRGIVREILHYDTVICPSNTLTSIEVMIEDTKKELDPGNYLHSIPQEEASSYYLFFRITLLETLATTNDRVNLKDMVTMAKNDGVVIGKALDEKEKSPKLTQEKFKLRDLRLIGEWSVAKIQRLLFQKGEDPKEKLEVLERKGKEWSRKKSLVELFPTRASSKLKLISQLSLESAQRKDSNNGQIIYREVFDFNTKRVVIIVYRKLDKGFNFFVYNAGDCSLFTKEFTMEEVKAQIPMASLFLLKKKYHELGFRIFKALKNNVIISMYSLSVKKNEKPKLENTQTFNKKDSQSDLLKTVFNFTENSAKKIKLEKKNTKENKKEDERENGKNKPKEIKIKIS